MMYKSAVTSTRKIKLIIFIGLWFLSGAALIALVLMMVSIRTANHNAESNKEKIAALELLVQETKKSAQIGSDDIKVIVDISSIASEGNRIYSPLHYIAVLEKEKPDMLRFEELSFDVKKGVFTAIVTSTEYASVTSYLENLEKSGAFKFAHLNKKGQVDRDGTRYQVEFGVREADSI